MAKKMITAQSILQEKGFQQNKFDTNGFCELVGNFFLSHEVKSVLQLVPKRFVAMKEAPACGYIDCTADDYWQKRVEDPSDPVDFSFYIQMVNRGLTKPMIYVDEPFIKNCAHLLALMGGYVVKKQPKGRFLVSLV